MEQIMMPGSLRVYLTLKTKVETLQPRSVDIASHVHRIFEPEIHSTVLSYPDSQNRLNFLSLLPIPPSQNV